jgi:methylase of polypeptide subunit release factors
MFNKDFYPTPKNLIEKMWNKVSKKNHKYILEPSAGKGDIVDFINEKGSRSWSGNSYEIHAIEIEPELQATLLGKGIKLVDSDFLEYEGLEQYDLIIANPPFSEGDKHLLKAIDILYSGEIVFLLNAETLKNPYSHTRQLLCRRLEELGADIEYIRDSFVNAERITSVEVALIHIKIQGNYEADFLSGADEKAEDVDVDYKIEEDNEIAHRKNVANLVIQYKQALQAGLELLDVFFKNYKKIWPYFGINGKRKRDNETFPDLVKNRVNDFIHDLRKSYWGTAFELPEFKRNLTSDAKKSLEIQIQNCSSLEFSEKNIYTVLLNIINNYENTLMNETLKLFDTMTVKYAWHEELHTKNVHYFNGWKTNQAYRVNNKVVLPWMNCFCSYNSKLIPSDTANKLNDIDKVMNFFAGLPEYVSIVDALTIALRESKNRGVESTFFKISAFKKGTVHLEFKDEDILRRFNITACRGKNWLPHDYGRKHYDECSPEVRDCIQTFEQNISVYEKHVGQNNSFKELSNVRMLEYVA